jgi:hypothetical protein
MPEMPARTLEVAATRRSLLGPLSESGAVPGWVGTAYFLRLIGVMAVLPPIPSVGKCARIVSAT